MGACVVRLISRGSIHSPSLAEPILRHQPAQDDHSPDSLFFSSPPLSFLIGAPLYDVQGPPLPNTPQPLLFCTRSPLGKLKKKTHIHKYQITPHYPRPTVQHEGTLDFSQSRRFPQKVFIVQIERNPLPMILTTVGTASLNSRLFQSLHKFLIIKNIGSAQSG